MTCAACDFEKQYGTKKNPRPIPDLAIHQCGAETCPLCRGYTVINGAPMGAFAVIGGDPCPACEATGRVPGGVKSIFEKSCYSTCYPYQLNNTNFNTNYTGQLRLEDELRCSLLLGHTQSGQECDYKPASEVNKAELERLLSCIEKAKTNHE